jgi:hypothetical protein
MNKQTNKIRNKQIDNIEGIWSWGQDMIFIKNEYFYALFPILANVYCRKIKLLVNQNHFVQRILYILPTGS